MAVQQVPVDLAGEVIGKRHRNRAHLDHCHVIDQPMIGVGRENAYRLPAATPQLRKFSSAFKGTLEEPCSQLCDSMRIAPRRMNREKCPSAPDRPLW